MRDAEKPKKPYKGFWIEERENELKKHAVSHKDELDKYAKFPAKMAMGVAFWAKEARNTISQHELEIISLKNQVARHEERIKELEEVVNA